MAKVTRTNIIPAVERSYVTKNSYVQCESSITCIYYLKVMTNVIFLDRSNVKIKRFKTNREILSQRIFMRNLKTLVRTVVKIVFKKKVKLQSSQGLKFWYPRKLLHSLFKSY